MTHELSKELLQKIIEAADEIITVRDGTNEDISQNDTETIIGLYDHFNDNLAPPAVVKELARFALVAYEQEPVADVVAWSHPNEERKCDVQLRSFDIPPGPLYTHPAPSIPAAVADEVISIIESHAERMDAAAISAECFEEDRRKRYAAMILRGVAKECRAAMLQTETQNTPQNIPAGLVEAVHRLFDSDGSRGCFSAIQCYDAHEEIERLLASAPKGV
ncbi:hypothetical protein KXR87_09055 [Yokenella regensburgei]|uniref:hypothetical protein n=1 Tax=Yokenella regensburgei TaxID=158877 RepID=UPI003F17CFA4